VTPKLEEWKAVNNFVCFIEDGQQNEKAIFSKQLSDVIFSLKEDFIITHAVAFHFQI
jgi:hypothetical protein